MTTATPLENPILNSPYDPPERYFELGPHGPTGEVKVGRRPSESFIPIPTGRRPKALPGQVGEQWSLGLDTTGERREANSLINELRFWVDRWRAMGYPRVTPVSRKLLQHWADPAREDRVLFCQREAAETAIYLAEVAGRQGETDFRRALDAENQVHNDGLPRVALKMATGTGKTIVMAMLIAWQTANKAFSRRDTRFTNRFLVVTPGITIRDRLRVLLPSDSANYYKERDLVPPDLWPTLAEASIFITNYHTFLLRSAREVQGVSATTKKVLRAGRSGPDPFLETEGIMAERVLRDLGGGGGGIVVLNDEAHHCYQDKPLDAGAVDAEAKERNEGARVWFRGLRAVARKTAVKAIYDLSATPYYLGGSGYNEGYIFPWTVSDFSLMDAIESGIVKVPRVPVDDDATGDLPVFLNLWHYMGDQLPKRAGRKAASDSGWVPPAELEAALRSLHHSYQARFEDWERVLAGLGEPPPVFIVVCSNTIVSKLVADWIAGQEVEQPDGSTALRPGALHLLSNVVDGQWVQRPRTILIDSAQLESGEVMKADFKQAAGREIEIFKAEFRRRNPGADVEHLTDEDLLREVMNTVGKRGRLGEQVRCVVSVSMLTEGWDANTVTHIMGIRAFGSQLLCEQVVGRGLRRRSYVPNAEGRFEPEYADVYGVPFAFIPSDRAVAAPKPASPAVEVRALEERADLRIVFPKVDGYRPELPEAPIVFDHEAARAAYVDRDVVATWNLNQGVIGVSEDQVLTEVRDARLQEVAFAVAADTLRRKFAGHDGVLKPWLFPALVDVTKRWLDPARGKVTFADGTPVGFLLLAEPKAQAAEAVFTAVARHADERLEILLPILRPFDGQGSTDDVSFLTRKPTIEAHKSHVNLVVLDAPKGTNTWEEHLAGLLEDDDRVAAYVKNDHLGFTIPYVWEGRGHQYLPDFLARLGDEADEETRTLIIEVSGGRKDPAQSAAKAAAARDQWCRAVNNLGSFGLWGYIEITTMLDAAHVLGQAIEDLRATLPRSLMEMRHAT